MPPRLLRSLRAFRADEAGAVSVDWVVLTGLIVALGIGVVLILQEAATDPAEGLGAYLQARDVG